MSIYFCTPVLLGDLLALPAAAPNTLAIMQFSKTPSKAVLFPFQNLAI
jgi:hypothetical protein